jgi:opacity protein-like surface antigen
MLKRFLIAAGIAGALAGFSQAAQAKVNVWIGAGPSYGYSGGYYGGCYDRFDPYCGGAGPGFIYRPRPYIYHAPRPVYYDDNFYDNQDYRYRRDTLSCREARSMVRNRGFRDVVARDCNGGTYSFFATKRGKAYRLNVNAYSGNIVSLRRI